VAATVPPADARAGAGAAAAGAVEADERRYKRLLSWVGLFYSHTYRLTATVQANMYADTGISGSSGGGSSGSGSSGSGGGCSSSGDFDSEFSWNAHLSQPLRAALGGAGQADPWLTALDFRTRNDEVVLSCASISICACTLGLERRRCRHRRRQPLARPVGSRQDFTLLHLQPYPKLVFMTETTERVPQMCTSETEMSKSVCESLVYGFFEQRRLSLAWQTLPATSFTTSKPWCLELDSV